MNLLPELWNTSNKDQEPERKKGKYDFSVSLVFGIGACRHGFQMAADAYPWLLGALAVALFVKARVDETAEWPRLYRSAGLIVVGYSVGRYLTLDALNGISGQLPGMLAATLSSIIVALLIAC
jgi:uncharacterized membrane protein AbrB (regulator of aidB expression)